MNVTKLEVDLNKISHNIEEIKKYTKKDIIPVIKANAYGTGICNIKEFIDKFKIVAIANTFEGIKLRENGYNGRILILNQPSIDDIDNIIKYDLIVGISSIEFLKHLKKKIRVHLEIETGMNRTGIRFNDLDTFINDKNLIIEGMYSHLSCADCDKEYTKMQYELFIKAYNYLKDKVQLNYIHLEASSGIVELNDDISNYTRPGIIMYGYYQTNRLNLLPALRLKTKITFLKEVDKNTSLGYSHGYITDKKMKVATIPIGYADGLSRGLSNKGYVVINNHKCKILGNICMDSTLVDVTDIDCKINDDVYIFDNDLIELDDLASSLNTISYEIISTINSRVEREYLIG